MAGNGLLADVRDVEGFAATSSRNAKRGLPLNKKRGFGNA
jgi:hypothetical protein